MIDGGENAIVRPFWIGNERKAYNVIANKKIIHLIKGEKKGEEKEKPENVIINIQFITNQRALLLVATVVSILAVDFPLIFPRRLCKTEEFGISLVSREPFIVPVDGCGCWQCDVQFWLDSAKDQRHGPIKGG